MTYLERYIAALEQKQGQSVRDLAALANRSTDLAHRELWNMCRRGRLFKLTAKPAILYFTTAAVRDSMAEQVKADSDAFVRASKEAQRGRGVAWRQKNQKPPKPKALVQPKPRPLTKGPAHLDIEPDTRKAVRTVYQTPVSRFAPAPDYQGPFGAIGIGKYLEAA